jgi:hypothetical protein
MILAKYEAARHALQAAHCVDEVKDIRDKAQAMAAYARQAKDTELIEWATEIKVRAERRAGEMLRETERNLGGRPPKTGDTMSPVSKLRDIGVSKKQSERWQKLAAVPEDKFEQAVAAAKDVAGEVTTAAMLRLARALGKHDALKTEAEGNARAARWRELRWQLEHAHKALGALGLADTPPCAAEERGRILIAWKAISMFLSEELGYQQHDIQRRPTSTARAPSRAVLIEGVARRV